MAEHYYQLLTVTVNRGSRPLVENVLQNGFEDVEWGSGDIRRWACLGPILEGQPSPGKGIMGDEYRELCAPQLSRLDQPGILIDPLWMSCIT